MVGFSSFLLAFPLLTGNIVFDLVLAVPLLFCLLLFYDSFCRCVSAGVTPWLMKAMVEFLTNAADEESEKDDGLGIGLLIAGLMGVNALMYLLSINSMFFQLSLNGNPPFFLSLTLFPLLSPSCLVHFLALCCAISTNRHRNQIVAHGSYLQEGSSPACM